MLDGDTGYVYVMQFDNETCGGFVEAIEDLESQGMKQLVIDLRNNPGGLVDEAALRKGLMVSAGDYGRPWFGQLMAGPQMLAYLVELNVWMERYHLSV